MTTDDQHTDAPKNEAWWDRAIRLALLPLVIGLWFTGVLPLLAAIPLGLVAAMLGMTGLTGSCPAYTKMGISTR